MGGFISNGGGGAGGGGPESDPIASAALATHEADSTGVHGITDTAALVVDGDTAGGVLNGTFPNPGFSNDMATQAELNSAVAAAVNDGDAAGGVLAGTYPNPSFASDMATQAELDAAKVYRESHTVAIMGGIAVPSGTTDVVPPFFVSVPSGRTAVIKKVRFQIGSGTSVTAKLQKNGSDISEYSGANDLDVATTAAQVAPGSPPSVADNDVIGFVVTAVSGSPENLSATIVIEVT